MQIAIHFVVSMAIGAMLARRSRRLALFALLAGALGVLPDLDHIVGAAGWPASWMHSGYLLVFVPFMLVVSAFVFDNATPEREWKAVPASLGILAILSGHLALDIAAGNSLPLAFPAEMGLFHAGQALLLDATGRAIIVAGDVAVACWALYAAFAFFAVGDSESSGFGANSSKISSISSSFRWTAPSAAPSR